MLSIPLDPRLAIAANCFSDGSAIAGQQWKMGTEVARSFAYSEPKRKWCSVPNSNIHILHRCRHQRTKKWDKTDEYAGKYTSTNIRRNESPQHATKCTLKRHLAFFTARVRNWYCITSCRRYTDLAAAKITQDIFNPG